MLLRSALLKLDTDFLLKQSSAEPGLGCCFTVYKAPSRLFAHLILGTGYYYPDCTDEETVVHRGDLPESAN